MAFAGVGSEGKPAGAYRTGSVLHEKGCQKIIIASRRIAAVECLIESIIESCIRSAHVVCLENNLCFKLMSCIFL